MIETATDVFRDAFRNGGGTYWVSVQRNRIFVGKSELKSGFYVSTEGNEWAISHYAFTVESVVDFISHNIKALTTGGIFYLGIWQSDSGRWYLDVSEHISDRDTALAVGAQRHQLAIYDIRRNVAIPVKQLVY